MEYTLFFLLPLDLTTNKTKCQRFFFAVPSICLICVEECARWDNYVLVRTTWTEQFVRHAGVLKEFLVNYIPNRRFEFLIYLYHVFHR